jgi:hypothetical protein
MARRFILGTAAAFVLALGGTACSSGGSRTVPKGPQVAAATTRHYTIGTNTDQSLAISLGFDVMDITGSNSSPRSTKAIVDELPAGVQALIWVGNLDNTDCSTPGYTTAEFRALVDAMATDRKVYGYYLADEPHPRPCTNAVADIRARADYLHAHSRFQKAFIVIQDGFGPCGSNLGCEFEALQPTHTHVDLVGVDPYPCHYDDGGRPVPCDYGLIEKRVGAATASGIPPGKIVPVFQAFGQQGRVGGSVFYRTPTTSELNTILATWKSLVPRPVLDFAYTFGVQCSTTCPAPQALANHPELQRILRAYNR